MSAGNGHIAKKELSFIHPPPQSDQPSKRSGPKDATEAALDNRQKELSLCAGEWTGEVRSIETPPFSASFTISIFTSASTALPSVQWPTAPSRIALGTVLQLKRRAPRLTTVGQYQAVTAVMPAKKTKIIKWGVIKRSESKSSRNASTRPNPRRKPLNQRTMEARKR